MERARPADPGGTPWAGVDTKKAQTLAKHLKSRGITAQHLETMHPSVLAHHAQMAGVSNPGPDLIQQAHYYLSGANVVSNEADLFKP